VEAITGKGDICIQTRHDNGTVLVRIVDTGRGIPSENLEKIFDPGFTTKGRGIGTGMGLPICRRIIEKHGGKIRVESELGKGTAVSLQLPLKAEQPPL
jgi:two-component system, NtrC family, sensor kinase